MVRKREVGEKGKEKRATARTEASYPSRPVYEVSQVSRIFLSAIDSREKFRRFRLRVGFDWISSQINILLEFRRIRFIRTCTIVYS